GCCCGDDRGCGAERQRVRRRAGVDDAGRARDAQPHRAAFGGSRVKNTDLLLAANTLWVVVAAVLVMFMQAGFAFLEAGLTRMKNAAHIAGKNVLIFGVASLVYWVVGFGLAFGDGNALLGTHGFAPSFGALLAVGKAPYAAFTSIPGAAGWLFEVVFAGVSPAIVWGALAVLGTLRLWFGWFGFNLGSTLGVATGGRVGFFGYVALTTNVAAAAGGVGGICVAWLVLRKPDVSMMLNGVLAALVAVTAAGGFVAPWAAMLIGFVAAAIAVVAVPLVGRLGIADPIGAGAVAGRGGVWGTLATGLLAVPELAATVGVGRGGLLYTGSPYQLGVQVLGLAAVGVF